MPTLASPVPIALLSLLLLLRPNHASSPTSKSNAPYRPTPRAPIIMLSTMDGTVSAYDARTGATLFTHRDTRPAVDSWAAPGIPDYIPSLDGLLYRIDHATDEAHVIHGKFISGLSPTSVPISAPDHADAVILTEEQSSVMLIDLRTGRVVANLRYSDKSRDPGVPGLSEHVVAISRTSVGVRVVEVSTQRELANASLVHNVPSYIGNQRCLSPHDSNPDAFVAYMTDSRDRLFVKSLQTGEILWSKDVSSSVVEAHGLGGVRIVANRRDAELVSGTERALPDPPSEYPGLPDAGTDVFVAKEGKSMYAMLSTPSEAEDAENSSTGNTLLASERKRKKITKYHVANVRDPTTLHSGDRPFGLGRLPLLRGKFRSSQTANDGSAGLAARDPAWILVALVVVGFVGYVVGSRPRQSTTRSQSRKKVKKRKRTGAAADEVVGEQGEHAPDINDDDEDTDSGLEDKSLITGIMARGVGSTDQNGKSPHDPVLEASNGSSGSLSGGGYLSNRTESGWMTVGCLQVSSKVLGVGSHGTVVYEGKMVPGERKVAVKRLLRQFYESARKEISLLVELDEASPHVVRYFAMEEDSEFIYLALELCSGSLAERVSEKRAPVPPATYVCGPPPVDTSRALRQLIQGLADLHRVGVVHRDVKPQNVLITRSVNGSGDVKVADVGLALRLADNRSSYTAVTNAGGGVGTTGWRAPEVLRGGRQTKAVDVFAAGCIVSYVLTKGEHPFGNAIFGRDGNIVAGRPSLEALEALNLPEATDIVKKMIDPVANNRPTAEEALRHPFFWTDALKLSFLVDISDRLYDMRHDALRYTEHLDQYALAREHCSDWLVRMDMDLLMGLGRQYENTASGLLRVIRNKRNHYSELSASLRKRLGPLPEDKPRADNGQQRSHRSQQVMDSSDGGRNFLTYFTSRVSHLLICVYQYAIENPALIDQPHFHRYGLTVARSCDQLPLHPLVRRVRGRPSEGAAAWRFAGQGKDQRHPTGADESGYVNGLYEDDMVAFGDDPTVAEKSNRRTYYRHELVAIQALCPEMHADVRRRAIQADVYQPSAFSRYKKRLESNEFLDSDFDAEPVTAEVPDPIDMDVPDVPPGFQRVIPRRQTQHGTTLAQRSAVYAGSPGSSRPPGFSAPRYNVYESGRNGNNAPTGQQSGHHNRRGTAHDSSPTPTISQWSGEERIVDFGSLRKQNR